MSCLKLFLFSVLIYGSALAQEISGVTDKSVREPRSLIKKKLCFKYGLCGHEGGYQGGQHGQHGSQHGGYQEHVPINIAISQSQSSANGADGSHGNGFYPNNYQYNGGYPSHGGYNHGGHHNQGYGDYPNQGYGGYTNQGYGGFNRPGYFGNGQGSHNNQFNGNYYGGQKGGGYGFQRPFRNYYSDESEESHEDYSEGFGFARSLAVSESKAK